MIFKTVFFLFLILGLAGTNVCFSCNEPFLSESSAIKNQASMDDINYIKNVAVDTFNCILHFVNKNTGLPYDSSDRLPFTSITNIGLYLASVSIGAENNLIKRDEAYGRIELAFSNLEKIPKWHGFPITWIDIETLDQTFESSFSYADHVGNLIAGLLVTRSVFPEFKQKIDAFINQMDFSITYDERTGWLKGGYDTEKKDFAIEQPWGQWYHYLLAADTRIFSFYGVASDQIPIEHWLSLNRTYETRHGLKYYNPGWQGGGLFMQYLPGIFLDEEGTFVKESAINFAKAQIVHAEKIESPVWGWSASLAPDGRYLGWGNIEDAVVTPHASVLAIEDFPGEVLKNLKQLEELGVRGRFKEGEKEFGFFDAYNYQTGEIAEKYLVLDQAMVFLSLANFLWDNTVRKHFNNDPIIKRGYEILNSNY